MAEVSASIAQLKGVMDQATIDNNEIAKLTIKFQSDMNLANAKKQAGNASAVH